MSGSTSERDFPIGPRLTVADFLALQIEKCGKTQTEIARECGFASPNIITMFKQGRSKLPFSRVGSISKALGVDPVYLYGVAMQEYEPETWAAIQPFLNPVVTQNEMEIIQLLRQCDIRDPRIRTAEEKARLLAAFNALSSEVAEADQ